MGSRDGRFSRIMSGAGFVRGMLGIAMLASLLGWAENADAQCITVSRSFPQFAFAGGETQFPVEVTITSTCDTVFAVGLREQLPPGWIWKGVSADDAESLPDWNTDVPEVGGLVEYLWIPQAPYSFPITFTYFVEIPPIADGQGVDQAISGTALFRVKDGTQQSAASQSTAKFAVPPSITLLGSPTVVLACGDSYVDAGATASDPAEGDITSRIVVDNPVNVNRAGTYIVTYGVSNSFQLTASAQRAVTVTDTTPPSITLLGESSVTLECGTAFVDPGATAIDTCEGVIVPAVTGNVDNRTPGTYILSYIATDSGGNSSSPATRTVRVVDTRIPVITLIGATVTVECGSPFVDPGATAADSCEGNLSADIVRNASAVNTSRTGTYTVTYNVTDGSGNRANQVSRTVIVQDSTRPNITLNGAASLTLNCGTTYTELGATASDACAGALSVAINASGLNMKVPGTYTVRYTATDGVTQPRVVNRTINVVDSEAPVIALTGGDVSFVECGTPYQELSGTVTDNCDTALQLLVSGATVYSSIPGSYRVKYSVTDGSGNSDEASRLVIVQDTTAPVVTLLGSDTVTVECTTPFIDPGATALDACDGDLTARIVVGGDRVNASVPGNYAVTYTATDAEGNTATPVIRTVRVVDTTRPEIRLNGGNVELFCNGEYVDQGASAVDDCDGNLTNSIVVTGAGFNTSVPGVYSVTYTVTDASGNRAQVVRQVTVLEAGCGEEGEGEGTPTEGEGEGDIELPACAPESVTLLSPTSNLIVPVGSGKTSFLLQAQVLFGSEPACELPSNTTVIYAIDGVTVGSSTNATAGYPVTATLGLGTYVLSVTALPADRSTAVSAVRTFSVLEAIDEDNNGILDNPFANMPGDGDIWQTSVATATCDRSTVSLSFFGGEGEGDLVATLTNPANAAQTVELRVNRGLLLEGEQGIVIATLACSLQSLFDPYPVTSLIQKLPAGPISGESYLDISIIVSSDGGATYSELDEVEVDGAPAVEVLYQSPSLLRGSTYRGYPSEMDTNNAGIALLPGNGAWTRQGIENVASSTGRIAAKLRHLSTFALFVAVDLPAELVVDQDALAFGSLVQGGTRELSVTISNTGDAALSGTPTIEGNGFELLDDSAYTLGSGESRTLTVRFSPSGVSAFNGLLRLTGGSGGDVTVALSGVGTLFDKGASATGCGSNANTDGGRLADVTLVLTVLAGLYFAARRQRAKS